MKYGDMNKEQAEVIFEKNSATSKNTGRRIVARYVKGKTLHGAA